MNISYLMSLMRASRKLSSLSLSCTRARLREPRPLLKSLIQVRHRLINYTIPYVLLTITCQARARTITITRIPLQLYAPPCTDTRANLSILNAPYLGSLISLGCKSAESKLEAPGIDLASRPTDRPLLAHRFARVSEKNRCPPRETRKRDTQRVVMSR